MSHTLIWHSGGYHVARNLEGPEAMRRFWIFVNSKPSVAAAVHGPVHGKRILHHLHAHPRFRKAFEARVRSICKRL